MGNQLESLEAEALRPRSKKRAALAQLLLAGLDEDTEIDEARAIETEGRIVGIESGAIQLVAMAGAPARVRAALV